MEVFALRAFQRVPNRALGATELARLLSRSVPHSSRLMKRMRARGLLREGTSWHNHRSMVLTDDAQARLAGDAERLDPFARQACAGVSEPECRTLMVLLARIVAHVRA